MGKGGGDVVRHRAGRAQLLRLRLQERRREEERVKRKGDEREKTTGAPEKNKAQRQQGGDARKRRGGGGERLAVCERGVSLGLQLSSGRRADEMRN